MINSKITGIILAGGKSSRMGTEKGLLKLGHKHMIQYAIDVLSECCDEVIISSNSDAYDFLGLKVIKDISPNSGPMGGIYSGLMSSTTDLNIVLSCDMPYIPKELIRYLVSLHNNHDVVVPWHGEEKFEPMCGLYHKSSLKTFEKYISKENFKIPDAYKEMNTYKALMNDSLKFYHPKLFYNLNSKKELESVVSDFEELEVWNNLLLIAGTGRNVGKTSLACKIIKHISDKGNVVGIKISPHMHTQSKSANLICETKEYSVYQEYDLDTDKDSSRMLKAGARKVFYIQSEETRIGEAFKVLSKHLDRDTPIVCESGGLRNYIKPSLFFICDSIDGNIIKERAQALLSKADRIIKFKNPEFDFDLKELYFKDGIWKM